ncbi:hypothetical protein AQJ30_15555 [Streptomyces longwoodensis]|uniref:Uncharacterized protein n=1 Tax=Streptomyces longwoodensis TaxID=68231 RepID=A0A101QX02_9ACTN|nr:magnesium chelatase domain-containing protein [Streptomyces longwoodensis]KUN37699.1 hypothetical protein AQJ30_15555 [Streptomyces longwoodensis]
MTTTDPGTAYAAAYDAAAAARLDLYAKATAYIGHLVRGHLPQAATLVINAKCRDLHEVQDAEGLPIWHAPTSAGQGLPDEVADEVDGILADVMPFGGMAGAARWPIAPQGLPYRLVRLPGAPAPANGTGQRKVAHTRFPTPEGLRVISGIFAPAATPRIDITGTRDTYARETRDRIRAAIINSGYTLPTGSLDITADWLVIRSGGPAADLATAAVALEAVGLLPADITQRVVLIGELGLDGTVRTVRDIEQPVAAALGLGEKHLIVPAEQTDLVGTPTGVTVTGAYSLAHAVAHLAALAA